MPTCMLAIEGYGDSHLLREIVSTLSQRRVDIRTLSAVLDADLTRVHLEVEVGDAHEAELVVKRLNRIVSVVKVTLNDDRSAHVRVATVVLVRAESTESRTHVLELARALFAEVLEINEAGITLSICATPAKRAEFLALVDRFGVIDLAESGPVALRRARRRTTERKHPQLKVVSA